MGRFEEGKHPRSHGKFAHVASGDKAAKKAAVKRGLTSKDILVGGRVFDSSEIAEQPFSAKAQATHAEARKYANMNLRWPTREDYAIMDPDKATRMRARADFDAQENFVKAQFHGILGKRGLDTGRENTATLDDIMAHTGLPEARRPEIERALSEMTARGTVFHNRGTGGYWINKAVGSGRRG
jgi:hypothetical protein